MVDGDALGKMSGDIFKDVRDSAEKATRQITTLNEERKK